jgi:excisionase family DNA binding protein
MLTTSEAAGYLRLSKRTLERIRVSGLGPKFVKYGRTVRYRQCDLDQWIASRVVRSTSEAMEARLSPQRVRTLIELLKIVEPKRKAVDHKNKGDLATELDKLDRAKARSNKARIFQLEDLRGREAERDPRD